EDQCVESSIGNGHNRALYEHSMPAYSSLKPSGLLESAILHAQRARVSRTIDRECGQSHPSLRRRDQARAPFQHMAPRDRAESWLAVDLPRRHRLRLRKRWLQTSHSAEE